MTREEQQKLSLVELENALETALEQHKLEVEKLMTPEQVTAAEEEIIKELQDNDKYFEQLKYSLPDGVEFDGKHYSKNDVAQKIIYFLNKNEVKWELTLGLYQLVKMWKNKSLNEIEYKSYDSTLRCLNQTQYKGFQEWQDILAVNEYLSACHEVYTIDTSYLYAMSDKHNAIMNRVKELDPEAIPDQPMAVEQQC